MIAARPAPPPLYTLFANLDLIGVARCRPLRKDAKKNTFAFILRGLFSGIYEP